MIRNYFKLAYRNLTRNKLFSALNVLGLALGFTCSILIGLWAMNELSYDTFNPDAGNIYRLIGKVGDIESAVTPPPVGKAVIQAIPQINAFTRLAPLHSIISANGKIFDDKQIYYADPNFLQFFNYPLLQGSKAMVLNRPDGVVLTGDAARKYFGETDPIGKLMHIDADNGCNYVVTGVLKSIPANSHLQFDMLLSMAHFDIIQTQNDNDPWNNFAVYTYLQTTHNFNGKLPDIEKKLNALYEANKSVHTKSSFKLQPLSNIHLYSHFLIDVAGQGNRLYVRVFSLAAIFLLLIACINFVNLTTAAGSQRAKEVGLRKTLGAERYQLIFQFLGEAVLLALAALIISVVLIIVLLPAFNNLTGKNISLYTVNPWMAAALLATAICTGILSGLYPALVLSSFKPAQVIKGAAANTGQKSLFRNILVVFQFAVSVVLLVCTLVISGQLQFIRSHNIGFNKQNLLYAALPMMNDTVDHAGLLKTILSKYPATANYTVVDHLPTDLSTGGDVSWSGKNPNQQAIFPGLDADQNFIKTFGMNMVAGRFFLENNQADRHNYVINEEALKTMNRTADQMLGQQIKVNGREGNVIGIVKNFNFKSVQHAIEPLIITDVNRARFLVIRTNESDTKSAIISLMSTFKQAYQNYPLTYGFVDQDIERLYDNDQQMGRIFNVFSIISIIISCLGLFGLATFTAIKRQKEVGVRRVLGATISRIVVMLSFDFIKLIIVSLLIAFPLSWWLMNSWLSGFAYRNGINCWIFIASGGAAIIIALLTISYQSITTALQNPVKSLKNE